MINLDGKTNEMKNALLTIDGWNFSFKTREMIRFEYKTAIKDGKLVPKVGKVDDTANSE